MFGTLSLKALTLFLLGVKLTPRWKNAAAEKLGLSQFLCEQNLVLRVS